MKTRDPVVFFANLEYTHNFQKNFDDISTIDGKQPGTIDLGDSINLSGGMAFVLNEQVSFSASYAQSFKAHDRAKNKGDAFGNIPASDSAAGTLSFGSTYVINNKVSIIGNVSAGVTPDAPDVAFTLKVPYNLS